MMTGKTRKRTLGRELALKVLFAKDISGGGLTDLLGRVFRMEQVEDDSVRNFASELVKGVTSSGDRIDEIISSTAENWHISRMATTDRNIIRIAVYELLFTRNVPPKVAINEAIEMAKKYGDTESGKFVNGILDKVKSQQVDK